jgi:surface antigen
LNESAFAPRNPYSKAVCQSSVGQVACKTAKVQLQVGAKLFMQQSQLKVKTEEWLSEMDFSAENRSFDWAGKTKLGVVIFLLRHNLYHIGELSSLLNESRNGEAEDNWVKAL